jgi:hypothetical protein
MEDNEKKLMEGQEEEEEQKSPVPNPAATEEAPVSEVSGESVNSDVNEGATSASENPEPVSEEPAHEEPVPAEEPVSQEPVTEEPVQQEPVVNEPVIKEEDGAVETSIKTFTQPELDKIVGDTRVRTREKTFRYIYDRYGVKDEAELDALVANAQRYDTQKEMYDNDKASWEHERDENSQKLADMSEQIALMQSNIAPERYEDAKLILKGKGMDVTLENIQAELETHPEWAKEEAAPVPEPTPEPKPEPKPIMRIKTLGNEAQPAKEESEDEQAQRVFKMKW